MGRCYEEGIGVKNNQHQAVYWYEESANQGYDKAQYKLGWCYENGYGVKKKDKKQAIEWYRKAAQQDNHEAKAVLKRLGESW